MANWGVRWNPWDQGYSALEVDQMTFLHKTYCEVYNKEPKDLPHILKMDDAFKVPLYMPVVGDFDEHTFVRKMQDMVGLLKNPAEGIISSICAYQTERRERKSFNMYMNDPRTLLLEEIKAWALNVLASASCTTEYIVNEVENRMQYIKKIQYGQQKLFTSGSGERSLMATLKDVREILEYRVLPIIETERAHASAKEQLTVLEAKGQDALVHGVQFLFYVFRNTPNAPTDCTIGNLQSQQHAGMKEAMSTKSGQMLQLLLETPGFKELFPASPYATSQKEKANSPQQLLLTNTPDEKKLLAQTAVFCDDHQNAIVPAILGPMTNPADFLKQSNSGVVTLPPDTAGPAFDKFCRLHAMLKLMADLIVSCRKARLLAGPGGDLLVYGPGGDAVRRLLQSWQAVQSEMRQLVTDMTTMGVQELDKLKTNQERNWRNCFKEVLSIQGYINNDIAACVEPIQLIYRNTDPAKVQRMLKEFREATGQWVEENSTICSQISGTLGLPAPAMPRSLEKTADVEMIEDDSTDDKELTNSKSATSSSSALVLSTSGVAPPSITSSSSILSLPPKSLKAKSSSENNNFIDSIGKSVVSIFSGSNANATSSAVSGQAKGDMNAIPPAPKSTPVAQKDLTNDPPLGTLDSLLMVRHVVQAMGSLSWSTRSTIQTCMSPENDREYDAYVIMCAVYEAVGVDTATTLWGQVTMYRHQLLHSLQMHLSFLLHVMQVLQHRMVVCSTTSANASDNIRSIKGMRLLFEKIKPALLDLRSQLHVLEATWTKMVDACATMKQGMEAAVVHMPSLDPKEEADGMAMYALNGIGTISNIGMNKNDTSASAIQSHMAYMEQLESQLDNHKRTLVTLQNSVAAGEGAVSTALVKLQALEDDMTFRKAIADGRLLQKQGDPKGGPLPPNLMADMGYIFGVRVDVECAFNEIPWLDRGWDDAWWRLKLYS
ncbi:hypothetical protein, variant 1 [Aphanomyces invadans]|uniref:Uncharacterized protein n=1 Tax=Aphanomyces invadans TaxID=157072 RepID=A0A024TR63_9STRA|nr:hypothetical protein, variant 1 [Aphanomyces invadans]ETV96503.1 hypothetical protein, variant 1 [Aphanomyces invadans]|eukprot:XP_008874767.1 hypothetical protein, variant 1 [Aphanomyces invadans]